MSGASVSIEQILDHHVVDLEKVLGLINGMMGDLSHQISFCDDGVRSDFDRITGAVQKFNHLVEQAKHVKITAIKNPSEFWSHTRHDLRTPINGIKNYAEMILEDIEEFHRLKNLESVIQKLKLLVMYAQSALPIIDKMGKDFFYEEEETFDSFADEEWHVPENSKILVIDDNPDNTHLLKRRLEQAGLTVFVSHNGFEGIEVARANQVDLILLDILMPVIDGYQVLDLLKKDIFLSTIPVLMISSVSELSSIVRCIRAGADDYLPTPFNPVLLRARITACLEKKKLHDRQQDSMRRLAAAQQQLTSAIESIDEGFAIFDVDDVLIQYNSSFNRLYAPVFENAKSFITYREFFRQGIELGIFQVDRRQNQTPDMWLSTLMEWHKNPLDPQIQSLTNGEWILLKEFKSIDGTTTVIHKNITDTKRKEDNLEFMALHDGLTGLFNRVGFELKLDDFIRRYEEEKIPFSLVYLDLDDFKNINDTLGHDFGDEVLKQVAGRFENALRTHDVVARLGGDEFAAIIDLGQDKKALQKILERTFHVIGTEVIFKGNSGRYGVSAGLAEFPTDAHTREDLMKAADEAMYWAKKSGKGAFRFYSDLNKE